MTGRAAQRRRLALLALLATSRSGAVGRERLIAMLWPEASSENGRHFLSDSVYRINQALGGDVILAAGDELRLDTSRLPSDVAQFEASIAEGDDARAAEVYTGAFLDGFSLSDSTEFDRWSDSERDRLQRSYASVLERLAEAAASRQAPHEAVAHWRKLAALDPYSARVAIRLMEALEAAGERAAAIHHARVYEMLVRDELEITPDEAVRAYAEALRAGRVAGARRDGEPVAARADGERTEPAGNSERSVPPQVRTGPRSRRMLASTAVAMVALVLAIGIAARGGGARDTVDRSSTRPRSVAVLPFASLSPDHADEYFSDGITEELTVTLAREKDLMVASRTSAFAYKHRSVDVREVGRRLRVDAVIEGSVRKSEGSFRISAQLVSTETGYTLWSKVYDRSLRDALSTQEEVARDIATAMVGPRAAPADVAHGSRRPQPPEAYDLFLKARHAWHRRTREGLLEAITLLEQATALAPGYARAHAGLADAHAVAAFYDYLPPRSAYPRAEAAARHALRLDSTLAGPHATLGYVLTYYHLDWPAAEQEFRRALVLEPDHSTAHQWYANLLTVSGRFDEAEREMRVAQEADPLSLIANAALGWTFYFAGRMDDALAQSRRTLDLDTTYVLAHLWGGWALESLQRPDEAREWIERAMILSRGSVLTRLALAHVLVRSSPDSARSILESVERRARAGEYVPSYEVAKVHLALGDRVTAMHWLERAAEERSHSLAFLRVDPQLAPLRGEPRFERLVECRCASADR